MAPSREPCCPPFWCDPVSHVPITAILSCEWGNTSNLAKISSKRFCTKTKFQLRRQYRLTKIKRNHDQRTAAAHGHHFSENAAVMGIVPHIQSREMGMRLKMPGRLFCSHREKKCVNFIYPNTEIIDPSTVPEIRLMRNLHPQYFSAQFPAHPHPSA